MGNGNIVKFFLKFHEIRVSMRLLLALYFLQSGSEKVHVKRFLGKAWHDNFIAPIGKATNHLK